METENLILRNWQENDAEALYKMYLDESLRKSGIQYSDSLEDTYNVVRSWIDDEEFKVIISKEDNGFVGFIILGDMNRYEGYMELEFAIAPEYRKRGYAVQAVKRILDYGFNELGQSVIAAWVRSHNEGSIRVLEKCAFTFEGRLRRHARDKSDTLCYSMLKEEWNN